MRTVRRNYFGYVIIIVVRIRNERRRADLIEEFKDLRLSPCRSFAMTFAAARGA